MGNMSLINFKKKRSLSSLSLLLVLIVLCALLSLTSPTFLTYINLYNLLRTTSITGLVAIGMTFVIITGGIDLSVGSIVGMSSVICGTLMIGLKWNIFLSILIAIIICLAIGLMNGLLIQKGKMPPFIVTLGTMQMLRGCAMLITNGRTLPGMPAEFTQFAQTKILGLSSLFIVWLVVIIIAVYILKFTRYGRNIYAIGSNIEAARLSGVKLTSTICATYMINTFCSAIAGILLTSRITSAQPTAGIGYEMVAIAAAVVGGASLSGAEGSIIGTVIGSVIMAVLTNGGNLLGINSFIMDIIIGALVIVAVLIEKNKKH